MSAGWPEPFAPDELAGQGSLVTGAAQGIGGAIATRLGELGSAVAVTDLNREGAEAKARELRDSGCEAFALRLDVRDTFEIEAAVSEAEAKLGRIDVLVNNAGLFQLTESVAVPDAEWQLQIDVMLTGPFKLTRRVARRCSRAARARLSASARSEASADTLSGRHTTPRRAGSR